MTAGGERSVMRRDPGRPLLTRAATALVVALAASCARAQDRTHGDAPRSPPARPTAGPRALPSYHLAYHETFDAPFDESAPWVEDTGAPGGPYEADPVYGDHGRFFVERGGATFTGGLRSFRAFRRSTAYGERGWLTVEQYGRDSDRDGVPETVGRFEARAGKARLVSTRHYDGAILRSTLPLPPRYRVEVTVSSIDFGGADGGSFRHGAKTNGYDGDERADPWRFTETDVEPMAATDNGVYFLCITDYPRPAPHNNVFIHHHRKVVMDTDSNPEEWSSVWDPVARAAVRDGSRYVSMIWLDGESMADDFRGNAFTSWTPGGWKSGPIFADKYLPGETYVFAIERDGASYALSVRGRFHHGGLTTYAARRAFREPPATWHYNQTPEEYGAPASAATGNERGPSTLHWPPGSAYPDYFFFGDPHINYYEGTAEFDDVKLFLPD